VLQTSSTPGGALCVWLALAGDGGAHLHPLDSHLHVFPAGLGDAGAGAGSLPFPAALQVERVLDDGGEQLPFLAEAGIEHKLVRIDYKDGGPEKLGAALRSAYTTAQGKKASVGSKWVAFTSRWLLYAAQSPAPEGPFEKAVWQKMPPPPPIALAGVVLCPSVEREWPEVAAAQRTGAAGKSADKGSAQQLVLSRAEVEDILEGSDDFTAARQEVRVCRAVLEAKPLEVVKLWAMRSS